MNVLIMAMILGNILMAHGLTMNRNAATLSSGLDFNEVFNHLEELQKIADASNGNRAVRTIGFNRSADYIEDYLRANTNLKVTRTYLIVRNYALLRSPTFSSTINGVKKTYTYSTLLSQAEYTVAQYSTSISVTDGLEITAIPNLGCSDSDWLSANPAPAGRAVLVKRGDCTFENKASLATKYSAAAIFIYNDGTASDRYQPVSLSLGQQNRLPALSLSYNVGQSLVTAISDSSKSVSVGVTISTDTALNPTANICADTLTGDPTQTIIIGSHSDSVPAGAGINDNGSGTAANLGLAAALSRLIQAGDYPPFDYRIRFCWWGAEEIGLVGSDFHVKEAKKSVTVGERLQDYLVNINLDMLGSPNFIFGIYNGKTAPSSTPASAVPGSNKISALFQQWFNDKKYPWDNTNFDGRSDYGPFLAEGIVCGGLFSGADGTKTVEQRNRYSDLLGASNGGQSGVRLDVCYHQNCDRTTNINRFSLNTMTEAVAYAIEALGRRSDLKSWLYSTRDIQETERMSPKTNRYTYNSINEYFGYPYD